jgi:hypothetical protein
VLLRACKHAGHNSGCEVKSIEESIEEKRDEFVVVVEMMGVWIV